MNTDESIQLEAFDEFGRKLDEGEKKGRELAKKGRKLTEAGQFMVDLSRSTRAAVNVYRREHYLEPLNSSWDTYNKKADQVLGGLGESFLRGFSVTGGSVAFDTASALSPAVVQISFNQDEWPEVRRHFDAVRDVVSRVTNKDKVMELMVAFGLDTAPQGKKSPLELFQTAHAAFEKPVAEGNPIITSLIPMRESIQLSIQELLRKRPKQEPSGKQSDKIRSIAEQLKRDSMSTYTIDHWADQWCELLDNNLSPAKEQDISREQWQHRLDQATLFVQSFLTGLDAAKMRPQR
jgi:hypothetical protein